MLETIGAAPGCSSDVDWHRTWRLSPEYQKVQNELARLRDQKKVERPSLDEERDHAAYREFAAPFWQQFIIVTQRVFQQYWRTPTYIYSKLSLCISASLFIGLVFINSPLSIQGLQNQMFAIFELTSIFGQLVDQQLPHFVTQRSLYEVRERPAKTYSWKVFMLSQIVAEMPWNTLASVFMWAFVYYPVGFYKNANAADQGTERAALMWLLFWVFMIFVSTFANMCITFAETADEGGNNANFLFVLIFFFCGVLATKDQMPGFWVFLYRVSPLNYFISAILSTGLANVDITCASNEYITLSPPGGQTCGQYMADYISRAGGYLLDSDATVKCKFCKIKETNVYLAGINSYYDDRWRNFGLMWVYVAFNIAAALALYWVLRMPKGKRKV